MPDKQRERFYLEALRRVAPEIPSGEPDEPEPPDFLLVGNGGQRLGIEFTSFHLPPPPGERPHQERQSLKERIVELAERLHHEAGGPPLYVGVYFNEQVPIHKGDTRPLARAIADSVLSAPMPRSMTEPVQLPWGQRPKATWGVQIHPSVDGQDKLWHADAGGWVADITAEHVAQVIGAKERTVPPARRRCDNLWLVVVNDAFSRAAPAEISAQVLEATYESRFDRVVWFMPHVPKVIDLQLHRPAG